MYPTTTLTPGTTSADVTKLQNWLISQGFSIPAGATGYYGDQTKAAVAAWQSSKGVDTQGNPGYWGPISVAAAGKTTTTTPASTPSFAQPTNFLQQPTSTTNSNSTPQTSTPVSTPTYTAPAQTSSTQTPAPTSTSNAGVTKDSSWQLSNWTTNGQGGWAQTPTLTVDGKNYTFSSPADYINMLNSLKNAGVSGPLDQMIGQFNYAIPEFTTAKSTPVNQTSTPVPTPAPVSTPVPKKLDFTKFDPTNWQNEAMSPGSWGQGVKNLQDMLVANGLMTQADVDTGYGTYGPKTTAGVLALQKALGIDYSSGPGILGPITIAAIKSNYTTQTPTSTPSTPAVPISLAPTNILTQPLPTNTANSTPATATPIPSKMVVGTSNSANGKTTYYSDGTNSFEPVASTTSIPNQTPAYDAQGNPNFTPPAPISTPIPSSTVAPPDVSLQPGSTGADVEKLQRYLVASGYMTQAQMDTGPGTYGPQTTQAVAKMQAALGVDNSSGVGYYGPKTQDALKISGQTSQNQTPAYQPDGTPNYSTQPTTQTPAPVPTVTTPVASAPGQTTTATPSQSGIPGYNLQPGDTGDKVTALQKWLIANGIHIPSIENGSANYGYFGPETQAAVTQLQNSLGMQVPKGQEGFYGPMTQSAITTAVTNYNTQQQQQQTQQSTQTATYTSKLPTTTTGDPKLDAAYAVLKGLYDQVLNSGAYAPNPNLSITPELVSQFLSEAHQVVDPYTQQTLTNNISSINASLKNIGNQYGNQVGQTVQDYQSGLANTREAHSGAGTVFSGLRGLEEQNTTATANRTLSGLDNTFATNMGNALRSGAAIVGNGINGMNGSNADFQTPQLNSTQVSSTGARGLSLSGGALDYGYNPSAYKIGSIGDTYNTNLANQSAKFQSDYLQSAANNGRTLTSLSTPATNLK